MVRSNPPNPPPTGRACYFKSASSSQQSCSTSIDSSSSSSSSSSVVVVRLNQIKVLNIALLYSAQALSCTSTSKAPVKSSIVRQYNKKWEEKCPWLL